MRQSSLSRDAHFQRGHDYLSDRFHREDYNRDWHIGSPYYRHHWPTDSIHRWRPDFHGGRTRSCDVKPKESKYDGSHRRSLFE
jgi:hypothetical protein